MSRIIPFNKFGIIGLESINARVDSGTLTFEFEGHPYTNTPFNGIVLIHLVNPAPSTATADMPIYFESRGLLGSRKAVMKAGGVPMTAADVTVPSYNLFFYDFNKGIVEGIAGVQPTAEA